VLDSASLNVSVLSNMNKFKITALDCAAAAPANNIAILAECIVLEQMKVDDEGARDEQRNVAEETKADHTFLIRTGP